MFFPQKKNQVFFWVKNLSLCGEGIGMPPLTMHVQVSNLNIIEYSIIPQSFGHSHKIHVEKWVMLA